MQNLEVKNAPSPLTQRDIGGIEIQFYLILAISKLHGHAIVPFVDVFVDVLDGLDRRNALHIYMTVVLPDRPSTVWNNPAILVLGSVRALLGRERVIC